MFISEMTIEEMNRLIKSKGGILIVAKELSTKDMELYIEKSKKQFGYSDFDFGNADKVGGNCFYLASALQKRYSDEVFGKSDFSDIEDIF